MDERPNCAELQQIFDLRWQADQRAIKRWQAATGRTMTWPDHADLCVWLMEQLDAKEANRSAEPFTDRERQMLRAFRHGVNTVDLRERIATSADFTPNERDFILSRINADDR